MQTYQMRVSHGRDRVTDVRRDLFAFPEVIDVFVAGQPDALVVVFVGRPRPGEWTRALRALGYDIPPRRHVAPPPPEIDGQRRLRARQAASRSSRRFGRVARRPVVG
jgi:hypothetical protein